MKNDMIKSVVVLLVICLVISGALSVINSFTAPVIEAGAAERAAAARQQVMPDAASFEEVSVSVEGVTDAYKGLDGSGNVVGYVITSQDGGFGGNITVMTGISADGHITKCQALDLTAETATLGGQWAKESWTGLYTGLDKAGVTSAWDAKTIVISGSTITSSAFEDSVLKAFSAFETLK